MRINKLSERDYEVLKYLAYGPSNIASIGKKFFPRQNGNNDTLNQKSAFSKYLYKRFLMLQNAGLLQFRKVDRFESPIVVLQSEGAREVAIKYGIEIDSIKTTFPRTPEIMHDLMVASTIRKMVEEAEEHKLYKIEYIHTEYFVRKASGRRRPSSSKGSFFPDFRIRIVPYKGDAHTFDVEIDAGTLGRGIVFKKISSFKEHKVLLVAPTAERIKMIFHYLQTDIKKGGKLPPIFFVLWGSFVTQGLRFSDVITFPTGQRGKIPFAFS